MHSGTIQRLNRPGFTGGWSYVSVESIAGAVLYAKDMHRVAAFYAEVLGLHPVNRDEEHVVLESRGFQLVVLRIPSRIASTIEIAVPLFVVQRRPSSWSSS